MLIVSSLWALTGIFYLFCIVSYWKEFKFFMNNMKKFNPLLVHTPETKTKNILIMLGCAVVAFVGAVGLLFNWWWALILAIIISGNEAYRGAVTYMKKGEYYESIKHQLIHAFVIGFIICYILIIKLGWLWI